MNNEINISVVIPVYNSERYLEQAIESVLKTRDVKLELIIVNDGSTDDSDTICRRYAAMDQRIRYITQANAGVASARDKGVSLAVGEYIAFLDSDDFVSDCMYSRMYRRAKEGDFDFVSCGNNVVYENSIERKPLLSIDEYVSDTQERCHELATALITAGKVCEIAILRVGFFQGVIWDTLIKRKFIEENCIKFISFWNNEDDYLFKLQCYLFAKKVLLINDNLYNYRMTPLSLSRKQRYIPDIYNLRNQGRTFIYGILDAVYNGESSNLNSYKGTFQRNILLFTFCNETSNVCPNKMKTSICILKKAVLKEKEKGTRHIYEDANFVEKIYIFLMLHGMYRLSYWLIKLMRKQA